jgi:signal transduction histidine kinase/CheY-like chemotaxis protein
VFAVSPGGQLLEENVGLGWLFRVRGPVAPPSSVVVVAIDSRSAIDLGVPEKPREWPRSLHGRLIEALVDRGAEVIAFDLMFARAQAEAEDAALARAMAQSERVLLVEWMERECGSGAGPPAPLVCIDRIQLPLPVLAEAAWGVAPFALPRTGASRVNAFWAFLGAPDDRPTLPALAVHARGLRREEAWQRMFHEASGGIVGRTIRIDDASRVLRRRGRTGTSLDAFLPGAVIGAIEPSGGAKTETLKDAVRRLYAGPDTYYLNFYGPAGTIRHIPYAQVLAADDQGSRGNGPDLDGVAAFVGSSELGKPVQADHYRTVFTRDDGVEMSGAEIAATAYANLLTGSTLRPLAPIKVFVLVGVLGIVLTTCAYVPPPRVAAAATAGVSLIPLVLAQVLFERGALWLPLAVPMLVQVPAAVIVGAGGHLLHAQRQRRRAETATAEAHRESAAKSEFLATMSHEIRNLLTWVVGLVDKLDQTGRDDEQRETIQRIRQFSDSLLQLLNDILDFAKLEAGELRIVAEAVAVRPLVRAVVDMLGQAATEKGLTVSLDIAETVPECVRTDPLRLCQILWNLIGNGIKFTERGSVTVRVDAEGPEGERVHLAIAVTDTGSGISEQAQSQLFRPFSQVDGAAAGRLGGTGLGLSIARSLADRMGGTITLASRLGEGSTFTVSLPVAVLAAETLPQPSPSLVPRLGDQRPIAPATGSAPATALAAPGEVGEVLVAEDDPLNRLLIQGQLRMLGLKAQVCADGNEAWANLEERAFDLLITDRHMPAGADGIELSRRIRGDPRFRDLRIIGLTADARPDSIRSCLDAGMNLVLLKPLMPADLPDALLRLGICLPGGGGAANDDEGADLDQSVDPAFDPSNIVHAFGSLDEQARAVLASFIEQAGERIAETKRAAADRDQAALVRMTHRLTGSSASIGAPRLARAFAGIEDAARMADWVRIDTLIATLDRRLDEVAEAVATRSAAAVTAGRQRSEI